MGPLTSFRKSGISPFSRKAIIPETTGCYAVSNRNQSEIVNKTNSSCTLLPVARLIRPIPSPSANPDTGISCGLPYQFLHRKFWRWLSFHDKTWAQKKVKGAVKRQQGKMLTNLAAQRAGGIRPRFPASAFSERVTVWTSRWLIWRRNLHTRCVHDVEIYKASYCNPKFISYQLLIYIYIYIYIYSN
jgi:hypothetical protein